MLFTALNMEMRCMSQNKTSSLWAPKKPTDSTRPIAESRGAQLANTAAFMRSSIACGQAGGNGICSNERENLARPGGRPRHLQERRAWRWGFTWAHRHTGLRLPGGHGQHTDGDPGSRFCIFLAPSQKNIFIKCGKGNFLNNFSRWLTWKKKEKEIKCLLDL